MKALLVQPDKYPSVIEIENELDALQKAVGGWIEVLYPFDAMVAVICNEEGKIRNLPMNRALRDANGNVYDVIYGDFLVVGINKEEFTELTEELIEKVEKAFHRPEGFFRMNRKGELAVFPLPEDLIKKEKDDGED